MDRGAEEPVVGFCFPILGLFRFNYADDSHVDQTTDMPGSAISSFGSTSQTRQLRKEQEVVT
jgi:hypothetical protein